MLSDDEMRRVLDPHTKGIAASLPIGSPAGQHRIFAAMREVERMTVERCAAEADQLFSAREWHPERRCAGQSIAAAIRSTGGAS